MEVRGSLPAAIETAILVSRDYWVSLFFAQTIVDFNTVSDVQKTAHYVFARKVTK
jgi:hypothetical protein